jgi:hypothetical protein
MMGLMRAISVWLLPAKKRALAKRRYCKADGCPYRASPDSDICSLHKIKDQKTLVKLFPKTYTPRKTF